MVTIFIIQVASKLARLGKEGARRGAKRSGFAAASPARRKNSHPPSPLCGYGAACPCHSEVKTYTSLTFLSGRLRTGLPVAAKMALSTAGATTQMVGSPTPPQKS